MKSPKQNRAFEGAADKINRWYAHPELFVREELGILPDAPQEEILREFPRTRRQAMAASKGTGKTAVEAWIIWYFLLTRRHPKIAVTSVDEANLRANLWTEVAKWQQRSELLKNLFHMTATRIVLKGHEQTWWCEARTWPKTANPQEQSATLAGLHANNLLFVLDESGGIPDAVMASAEAALSTGGDTHILQAGNTTQLSGPLYKAATSERRLWHLVRMNGDPDDPNRSARVDLQWARDQIEKYGRNNPWVLINVFGQFPPHSVNALIGPDEMHAAEKRSYRDHDIENAARVLGVDVARYGEDCSVMFPRQGLVLFEPTVWRNVDGIYGAAAVSRKWDDWDADACFVDNTGGFGAAWIDCMHLLGRQPVPVQYAGKPHDDGRFWNKRAEMYWQAAEWLKDGGQIPVCSELVEAMTQVTYTFRKGSDKILIEDKDQFKLRLGFSPDHADAFVQTFAEPISRRNRSREFDRARRNRFKSDSDPYAWHPDEIPRL